jgi:hypothetical protein
MRRVIKRTIPSFTERDPGAVPYFEKSLALPNYNEVAGLIDHEDEGAE